MRLKMDRARFGTVQEISKPDYIREVNQAGDGVWVVVHLYNNGYGLSGQEGKKGGEGEGGGD